MFVDINLFISNAHRPARVNPSARRRTVEGDRRDRIAVFGVGDSKPSRRNECMSLRVGMVGMCAAYTQLTNSRFGSFHPTCLLFSSQLSIYIRPATEPSSSSSNRVNDFPYGLAAAETTILALQKCRVTCPWPNAAPVNAASDHTIKWQPLCSKTLRLTPLTLKAFKLSICFPLAISAALFTASCAVAASTIVSDMKPYPTPGAIPSRGILCASTDHICLMSLTIVSRH